ncbi:MAG: M10 family metallopeptidase C-terminal domain-containing protein [Pseudomonadota bacterium]|nr:M10 family metallopeptidase C-terminal domain-containing protein [Pseudomonadota bacterium]
MTGRTDAVFDPWLTTWHWNLETLTYSFPRNGATYRYQKREDVSGLNAEQRDAVRAVFAEVSQLTQLSFAEVAVSADEPAVMRFARESNLGGAYAYRPALSEEAGDAFFGYGALGPTPGNEAYLFFIHELGHTLGLNHGHDFGAFRGSEWDSQEFTIMTYTDHVGDDDLDSYDSGPIDWAQSYMQLDIAALQFLYGANYDAADALWSGDTRYSFSQSTGEMFVNGVGQGAPAGNRIFRTIWDGDGRDIYDFSNYVADIKVDLAPGGWSVLDGAQLANLNRNADSPVLARGNIANALLVDDDSRALIEIAIGGSGDDDIAGNQTANRLAGRMGDDVLSGKAGGDLLRGQSGDDRMFGNAGQDHLMGGGQHDVLRGGRGNDLLEGGNGADALFGGGGDDLLIGGRGFDSLTGGIGADVFRYDTVEDARLARRIDTIEDFETGVDHIDFRGLSAAGAEVRLLGAHSAGQASLVTAVVAEGTRLTLDRDGDGQVDLRILLAGVQDTAAGDFLL